MVKETEGANGILTGDRVKLTGENGRERDTLDLTTVDCFVWVESRPPRCSHKYSHVFFWASAQLSVEATGAESLTDKHGPVM